MRAGDDIARALRCREGDAPALVAFVTAGYPDRAGFMAQLAAVSSAAEVVEVGVPFSDPMADGVTIQRSSRLALEQGVTLAWILESLATRGTKSGPPLVLMSYLNPLLAFGLESLAERSARAGVCGFIVPDLPFDESEDLRAALAPHGVALIQMVTPVTTPERRARLCAATQGFVYAVTMTGTTGRNASVPGDVSNYLDAVVGASKLPVCAGFGIRAREQVDQLRGHVAGVIVGSALVEVVENGQDAGNFLRSLRA